MIIDFNRILSWLTLLRLVFSHWSDDIQLSSLCLTGYTCVLPCSLISVCVKAMRSVLKLVRISVTLETAWKANAAIEGCRWIVLEIHICNVWSEDYILVQTFVIATKYFKLHTRFVDPCENIYSYSGSSEWWVKPIDNGGVFINISRKNLVNINKITIMKILISK